jgi:hypothetical protein
MVSFRVDEDCLARLDALVQQTSYSRAEVLRYLGGYIRGRDTKPRATWFLAAKLPGVSRADDLKLACKLVDAVQAQNSRAGSKRTYHLVIWLHPEDRCLEREELPGFSKTFVRRPPLWAFCIPNGLQDRKITVILLFEGDSG